MKFLGCIRMENYGNSKWRGCFTQSQEQERESLRPEDKVHLFAVIPKQYFSSSLSDSF